MKPFPALSVPARLAVFIPLLFSAAAAQTAPATSTSPDEGTVKLPDFDVNSSRDVGYGARDAMGATRMDTDLDKTPTTVVVLDQEFLRDVGALDYNTALQYVSGINAASTPNTGQVSIRGFNQGGATYRDGLPQNTAPNGTQFVNMADIERFEIIKGPEGVLYGSVAGGGVINAVSKQPLGQQMTDVTFYAGSWDTYGVTVDNTGPANASGTILYRIIVNQQEGYTQVYDADNNDTFIDPSLTFKLGPSSDLNLRFAYGHWEKNIAVTPWFADEIGGQLSTFLSVRQNFDEPDEVTQQWQYLSTATFTHRFGDNWRLRVVHRENETDENKVGYNKSSYTFVNAAGQTVGTIGTGTSTLAFSSPAWTDILAVRTRKDQILYQYDYGSYADLVGKFDLGPIKNTLLFSAAYEDIMINSVQTTGTYPSTSVFNPVHYSNPLSVAGPEPLTTNTETATPDADVAAMDNISIFSDKLIFTAGGRRDSVDNYSTNRLVVPHTYTVLRTAGQKADSYKLGIVYRPVNGIAFFGDYASTFTPEAGSTYQGLPLLPEYGESREVGSKLDLFDGKLTATVSYFDIKVDNVPERVVVDAAGDTGTEQTGFVQSKGTELDMASEPLPGVTMLAGFGNTSSLTDLGVAQRNVPMGTNFKTFIKYAFPHSSWLKGFAVGGGYILTPRRAGDTTSTFFLPAYEEYNGLAYYERGHWRWQINGANLKNSKLAGVSSVNNINVYPGVPRSFLSSVEYHF